MHSKCKLACCFARLEGSCSACIFQFVCCGERVYILHPHRSHVAAVEKEKQIARRKREGRGKGHNLIP